MMSWNEDIKKMRIQAGYSMEEAANLLMISVTTLKAYEAGEQVPQGSLCGRIWRLYKTGRILG